MLTSAKIRQWASGTFIEKGETPLFKFRPVSQRIRVLKGTNKMEALRKEIEIKEKKRNRNRKVMLRKGWQQTRWIGNYDFVISEKSWTEGRPRWRPKRMDKSSKKEIFETRTVDEWSLIDVYKKWVAWVWEISLLGFCTVWNKVVSEKGRQ